MEKTSVKTSNILKENENVLEENENILPCTSSSSYAEQMLQKELENMRQECKKLRKINETITKNLVEERKHSAKLEKDLKKVNELTDKNKSGISKNDLILKVKEMLSSTLSANQIDLILKTRKKVRWSKDDISKAFTLRYYSKRAYLFMRKENFPLPNLATLQKYAQIINLKSGILHDILKYIALFGENMSDKERTTVLLYDEMKVCSLYEYDKKYDEIFGPFSYVQVVMARGLFSNWKQPVYVGFDKNMNKDLLLEIIVALHNVNYQVVAVVSDCGASNQGTWTSLGISVENVSFSHPVTNDKIYCFADAPHLLKLIRNWLLKTGNFHLCHMYIVIL